MPSRDVASTWITWTALRAVFHRGYWLATSLYLVVEAELSPFELVFIGTAQGLTALAAEVPTGVVADAISRKASLVTAHVVMSIGMIATGRVLEFEALVATQMCWGLGWTFVSGADVAWLTDELGDREPVDRVLTAGARWEQIGAALGMLLFGAIAWAGTLATAIQLAGVAMAVLGLYVALRFPERHFTPGPGRPFARAREIARRGIAVARADRIVLAVLAATLLLNGAAEGFDRLLPRRLIDLGLPAAGESVVFLALLGIASLLLGAVALRVVEQRIDRPGAARGSYAAACGLGALGVALVAGAPDAAVGMTGALLVGGIAWPVTRTTSVILVNRRTPSEVRATVQSLLGQVEYLGEIALGVSLGVVAQTRGIPLSMLGTCLLVVLAGLVVARRAVTR